MIQTLYFWRFASSSSDRIYTTLQISNESFTEQQIGAPLFFRELTCNCPGWCKSVKAGARICVHTRLVRSGQPEKDPMFIDSTNIKGMVNGQRLAGPSYPAQSYTALFSPREKPKPNSNPQPEPIATRSKRQFNFDDE